MNASSLSLTIPGAPVPKGRPRFFRGIAVTPARTRKYEKHARDVIKQIAGERNWEPIDGDYLVEITVYRSKRIGDLDNYAKSITDAANGILWPDDRMISALCLFREEDKQNPRVAMQITRIASTVPSKRRVRSDRNGILPGD